MRINWAGSNTQHVHTTEARVFPSTNRFLLINDLEVQLGGALIRSSDAKSPDWPTITGFNMWH